MEMVETSVYPHEVRKIRIDTRMDKIPVYSSLYVQHVL